MLGSPDAIKNDDGTVSIKPLTLKDNLREMYQSIVSITHVDANGDKFEGSIMESRFMASDEEKAAVREGLATLEAMIDALPDDLYCSPIDTICNAIRQAGYTVGEATGRKHQVVDMTDGMWRVALRKKSESKISYIERAFNFGEFDALVGNKAMTTGLSVHASKDFSDQRRRASLFTQIFADINDYVQAIGRTDRRGQIMSPLVEMLASGLPSEARVMMNHYSNLRKLLASTTSNRSSRFELQELPDLFNAVGDASVRDFLQANPAIATRLGIDFATFMPVAVRANGTEVEVQTRGLAKYAVARLDLLPVGESRNVYGEIAYNFAEVVAELDAQGVNPLRTNVIDLTTADSAMITATEDLLPALLNGSGEVDSVFNEAVELHTVTIKHLASFRTWEETLAEIERNSITMQQASSEMRAQGQTPDFVMDHEARAIHRSDSTATNADGAALKMLPSGLRTRVEKMFDAMQVMMRSSANARRTAGEAAGEPPAPTPAVAGRAGFIVNPAEVDAGGNQPHSPAQIVERRKNWLLRNLAYFMPGQYVSISMNNFGWTDYKSFRGVVTSISVPPRGRETNLSRWSVMIQVPGYPEPTRYTLQELYKMKFSGQNQWLPGEAQVHDGLFHRPVADEFNEYREVERQGHRYVLRGNLFRAASIAAEHNMGAGGVLQLKGEAPARIISIRKGMEKQNIYASVPVEISKEEATSLFCSTWSSLNRPPSKNAKYWGEFLRKGIDSRGIHSTKEAGKAPVSLYWLATRGGFVDDIMDGVTDEERDQQREDDAIQGERNLLAGVGARISKNVMSRDAVVELARGIGEEMGCNAVDVLRGRPGALSVRLVVRFKDENGERDTDEVIRNKLAVFTRQISNLLGVGRYFTHSPEMRLLALAKSAQSREQARAMRDAAEEARQMRAQMSRMQFADTGNDENHEQSHHEEQGADYAPSQGQ
jgi:hypothetical protein